MSRLPNGAPGGLGRDGGAMEHVSWDRIEPERLSEKITRRVLHGRHATYARFSLASGAVVSRHEHESEQYTAVLTGALKMIFDDREVVLRPGEMLFIHSREPHAAEALEDTTVQDVFAPRREDWIDKNDAYLRK
jgi:quercetin dioxygenase-like cupin family protein